jgi:hypothetical protein
LIGKWYYTPKHGSWLNRAELDLSVLSRQCLDRRIPDLETLTQAVAAWEQPRNTKAQAVNWRFTTRDARIKLIGILLFILYRGSHGPVSSARFSSAAQDLNEALA